MTRTNWFCGMQCVGTSTDLQLCTGQVRQPMVDRKGRIQVQTGSTGTCTVTYLVSHDYSPIILQNRFES